MKLIDRQKLLAELYTNSSIRKNYFPDDKNQLDEKEVTIFAEGLLHKRRNAVKGIMPFSFSYQRKLYDLFIEYASVYGMQGYHLKHQQDALAFCSYLENVKEIKEDNYLRQIIRYEKFMIRRSMPGRFLFFFAGYRIPYATEETIHKPSQLKGTIIMCCFRFSANASWKKSIIAV